MWLARLCGSPARVAHLPARVARLPACLFRLASVSIHYPRLTPFLVFTLYRPCVALREFFRPLALDQNPACAQDNSLVLSLCRGQRAVYGLFSLCCLGQFRNSSLYSPYSCSVLLFLLENRQPFPDSLLKPLTACAQTTLSPKPFPA